MSYNKILGILKEENSQSIFENHKQYASSFNLLLRNVKDHCFPSYEDCKIEKDYMEGREWTTF